MHLEKLKLNLYRKAILFIMQNPRWRIVHLADDFRKAIEDLADSEIFVFVGHFENKHSKAEKGKEEAAWKLKNGYLKNGTETVVLPYTIPIKEDDYKEYSNMNIDETYKDFQSREYSLFFMGSRSHSIRARALNYMTRPLITNLNPFGIVRPRSDERKGILPNCTYNENSKESIIVPSMPCLMDSNLSKQLNKDNKLYLHGLKNSKFNLMIRGDSPTSGKFYDSIAFNMINIFVGITRELVPYYLPFADVIPYHKFCFFITPQEFRMKGVYMLKQIVTETSEFEIRNMLGNLTLYKRDILWNMKGSRVVQNVFKEVKRKREYIMRNLPNEN